MASIAELPFVAPSLLDPRAMLLVPRTERPALAALWRFEHRLFGLVAQHREPLLAQMKLAWWRDRTRQIAECAHDIPIGEPLLQELMAHWPGNACLVGLVDAYEHILLAEDLAEQMASADKLANSMRALMPEEQTLVAQIWATARTGQAAQQHSAARAIWDAAAGHRAQRGAGPFARIWYALDRWGALVAASAGKPSAGAEGWLLLRAGLGW